MSRNAAAVASRLTQGVVPGDVLLLHDGASTKDAWGRPIVLEALPRVLDGLAARGLTARLFPEPPFAGAGE